MLFLKHKKSLRLAMRCRDFFIAKLFVCKEVKEIPLSSLLLLVQSLDDGVGIIES